MQLNPNRITLNLSEGALVSAAAAAVAAADALSIFNV